MTLHNYLKDNPRQFKNLMAGVYAFGHDEIERLIKTIREDQKLEFYYGNDEDLKIDRLSYRIVTKRKTI